MSSLSRDSDRISGFSIHSVSWFSHLDSSPASIFVLPGMYAADNQMLRLMQDCHISFVTALHCTEWVAPSFYTQATAVALI